MSALTYETSDHIATITLNRPERMNTISPAMLDELCDLLKRANKDPDTGSTINARTTAGYAKSTSITSEYAGTCLFIIAGV